MDRNPSGTTSENNFPTNAEVAHVEKDAAHDTHNTNASMPNQEPAVGEELVSKRVQMFENLKKSSSNILIEKKLSFHANVNIYNDLVASLIAMMVPNVNLKCAHRLKRACDTFDQSELEYLVKCLSAVPRDSRWTLVPSLVKNLKNRDYKDVAESCLWPTLIVGGESRSELPANFKRLVEKSLSQFSGEGVAVDEDVGKVVAVALLLAAVLRKGDEPTGEPNPCGGGDVLDNDEDGIKIQKEEPKNEKDNCDDLSDFHVEEKPFSQTMADFMRKDLRKRKNKKNFNKRREILSVDSALDGQIFEIDYCAGRLSEIADSMRTLNIENPDVVQNKVAELKIRLENIKSKIDGYVANVLDGEMRHKIDAVRGALHVRTNEGGDHASIKTDDDSCVIAEGDSGVTIAGSGPDSEANNDSAVETETAMKASQLSMPEIAIVNPAVSKNNYTFTVETKTSCIETPVALKYDDSSATDAKISQGFEDECLVDSVVPKNDNSSAVDTKISHGSDHEDKTVVDSAVPKDDSSAVDAKISHTFEDKTVIDSVVSKDDNSSAVDTKISHTSKDKTVIDSVVSKNDDSSAVDAKISHGSEDKTVIDSVISKDDDSSAVDAKISHGSEDKTVIDSVISKDDDSSAVDTTISHGSEDKAVVGSVAPKDDSSAVETKISHRSEDKTVIDSVVSKDDDSSTVDTTISHGSDESVRSYHSAAGENEGSSSESEDSFDPVKPGTKASDGRRARTVCQTEKYEASPSDKSNRKRLDINRAVSRGGKYSPQNSFYYLSVSLNEDLAWCVPCDASFELYRSTFRMHIRSCAHILNLQNFNKNRQRDILKSNRKFLNKLNISEGDLWSEKLFVDPENKTAYCGICMKGLFFNRTAVHEHIDGRKHSAKKHRQAKKLATVGEIYPEGAALFEYLKINRIIYVTSGSPKSKCLPCGVKLQPDTPTIVSHAESDEHCSRLDELNSALQREIVKSNPDLFGEGKRYPLTEKHFRDDKLFLNPVSNFAYCGVCRKEINLQDINGDVLSHLSSESHVDGLAKSSQNNAQSNVSGDTTSVANAESKCTGVAGEDPRLSDGKADNNVWYASLTKWVARSDAETPTASTSRASDEEVNSQSPRILADIVKMKGAGQDALRYSDFEHDAKQPNDSLKCEFVTKKNTVEVGQMPKKKKTAHNVSIDANTAKLHRLVPSQRNGRIACIPCGVVLAPDLDVVSEHVTTEDHRAQLCRYNCEAQREIIKKNPQIFGRKKAFHMTETHIKKDMMFVQPDGKFIFCGICVKELTYSSKNMIAHVAGPSHVQKRLQFFRSRNEKQILRCVTVGNPVSPRDDKNLKDDKYGEDNKINTSAEIEKNVDLDKNQAKDEKSDSCSVKRAGESSAEDSGILVPCTTVVGDKIVCLLCDVRNIPSQKCLAVHLKSPTHRANLKAFNEPQTLSPDEQETLMRNMIALVYGRNPLVFKCFACQSSCFFDVKTAFSHIKSPKHVKILARVKREEMEKQKLNVNIDVATSKDKDDGGTVDKPSDEIQNVSDRLTNTSRINDALDNEKQRSTVQSVGNSFDVYEQRTNEVHVERIRTENLQLTPPRVMPAGNAYATDNKRVNVVSFDHAKKVIRKTENGYMCVECNLRILSIPMAYAHLRSCGHSPVIVHGVQFLKEASYHCLVCDLRISGIKTVVAHISEQRHSRNFAAK